MLKEMGFGRGVNLGGWMSQCDYSRERLDRFITEEDIARIASWGLDHVRLPLDYNVLENEDGTAFFEEGFERVRRAYGWCRQYGLNLVLDLHKTAGFSFDEGERETGFFSSEALQERFFRLWEKIAQCIRRIRRIAPNHLILVGGYHNNSAHAVPALNPPADARVLYNFHCYEPLAFTHQGAPWVPQLDQAARPGFEEMNLPGDFFDRLFAPALEAAEKNGTELYCGEYGVIDRAAPEDTVRWFRMIHECFERHGIARCAWSYKEMDFGLSDRRLDGVRHELLSLL